MKRKSAEYTKYFRLSTARTQQGKEAVHRFLVLFLSQKRAEKPVYFAIAGDGVSKNTAI